MSDQDTTKAYESWTILELMGHRRLGGYVTEVEVAASKMIRIDVLGKEPGSIIATQFYGAAALYCLTPTTEAMARAAALKDQPEPIHRWELPKPEPEDKPAPKHQDFGDYIASMDDDEDIDDRDDEEDFLDKVERDDSAGMTF